MKRIILANMTLYANGGGNRGCQALAYSVISIIDQIMGKYGEKYLLYLPDDHSPIYGMNEVEINGTYLSYYKCDYPFSYKISRTIYKFLKIRKLVSDLKIFINADVVFDIGQGDSFSDIYGNERFKSIDFVHKLAIIMNKPYCLLPQTIGPFYQDANRNIALRSLNKASYIMTRDKASMLYCYDIGLKHNRINDYIDVAFLLPYKKWKFEGRKIKIGINISALLWNGGYTKNNQFKLGVDYRECIKSIVRFFIENKDNEVYLVPHVVSADKDVENDYYICSNLTREINKTNLSLSPFFMDPVEAKNFISGLDFFIGARMHSTIASFSSGVPTIPMSYSRKFDGLFRESLGYNYVINLKTESEIPDILNYIDTVFRMKENIKETICHINQTVVKEGCDNIINQIEKILIDD